MIGDLRNVLEQLTDQEFEGISVILSAIIRLSTAAIFLICSAFLYVSISKARKLPHKSNTIGIIFIMISVLLLAGYPLSKMLFNYNSDYIVVNIFFSTFNNGFVIASIPFLGTGFSWIRKIKPFRNRLVWVISSLTLCMLVSIMLVLLEQINPEVARIAELSFSLFTIALLGYASMTSFKSSKYNYLSLFIILTPFLCYLCLQLLIFNHQENNEPEIVVFRTIFTIITNSALAGVLVLTAINSLFANMEERLQAESTKRKKMTELVDVAEAKSNTLLRETNSLREALIEKDKIIQALRLEAGGETENIRLSEMKIGFDRNSIEKYTITFTFFLGNDTFFVKCSNNKLTVPHSHWIIFAAARKHNITLKHPDIAQIKFQMIKYLNSFSSSVKIMQEYVFRNNGGEFDINIDKEHIHFEHINDFSNNIQLLETFKKYLLCFNIPGGSKNTTETLQLAFESLVKNN